MCNKHVHADLMLQYAQDAQETDKPWERWEVCSSHSNKWVAPEAPLAFFEDRFYRRKRNTHIVNGKEVAAPLDKVVDGQTVWSFLIVTTQNGKITEYSVSTPSNWEYELSRGLLFATEEGAKENFDAHFPPRTLKA